MLNITGQGTAHTCDGISRRDFLQVGTLGAAGVSLAELEQARAEGKTDPESDRKSVIMIFNLGAPSQFETFDPKPEAPAEIRGPFKPIPVAGGGFQISEILPRHAQHGDKFSVVRSCHHTAAAVHDTGHQMTGGNLPHGQDAGFLGKAHDPFVLMADPSKKNFRVPDLLPPKSIGEARLDRRRRLRQIVDSTVKDFEASENAKLLDSSFQAAFRIITSEKARAAFDLSKEPKKVRDRYGMSRFGQCCLMARRLIEAGVRCVTVNTFLTVFNEITWDIHGTKPFTSIEGMRDIVAPMYDQAYSALLEDLTERGLLEDTLICNLSEFGRTPRVNPAGGRDHWPQCWSVYFAGGGVQGGRVIGKSDPIGAYPAEQPVEPGNVVATIFKSLGYDLEQELPGPSGRPFPLVDQGTEAINELF